MGTITNNSKVETSDRYLIQIFFKYNRIPNMK